jgi:hypothetical protein
VRRGGRQGEQKWPRPSCLACCQKNSCPCRCSTASALPKPHTLCLHPHTPAGHSEKSYSIRELAGCIAFCMIDNSLQHGGRFLPQSHLCLRRANKLAHDCSSLVPWDPVIKRQWQARRICNPRVPVVALSLAPCCVLRSRLQLCLHKCCEGQQLCFLRISS